jgi:cullin 3
MWTVLAGALQEIHTKNASQLSFETLYRTAYKIVLKKKGEALYNRVTSFEENWLSQDVRAAIRRQLGGSLLTGTPANHMGAANERRVAGEKFLRGLRGAWEDHLLCIGMTTDVLMYMVSFLGARFFVFVVTAGGPSMWWKIGQYQLTSC